MTDKQIFKLIKLGFFIILAICAMLFFSEKCAAQNILLQMQNAPKLCESPKADSIFDRHRLPAIRTNIDSTIWEFCSIAVRDMRPDADQFSRFCVAEFVEIGGVLYFIAKPPIIQQYTTARKKTYFGFYDPKKCEFMAGDMIARSTSLPTWFFINPAGEKGCIHAVKVEPSKILADKSGWRITDHEIFCKP